MKMIKVIATISVLLAPMLTYGSNVVGQKYIIVAALEQETANADLEQYAPIVYTGVGKVNAAIKLYDAIVKYQPDLVINYGTAGSINGGAGLYHIDTFVQVDMDTRPLGTLRGVTPFSEEELPEDTGVVLGTGDSFITDSKNQLEGLNIRIDFVDMEGYALNKVCTHLNVAFQSYKNVSDSADSDANEDWSQNVSNGVQLFKDMLRSKYGVSQLIVGMK
ncbi:MAG: adenosylhomocysteine nucleosidase [Desulforhopalus sp.]|jgi:adenosylhomocysteine nucleosidase